MPDVLRVAGFAIMTAAFYWFAKATTLAETDAPCLLALAGLGVYFAPSVFRRRPQPH